MRIFSRALAERKAEQLQRYGCAGQRVDCSAAAPEALVAALLARMVCVLDADAALGSRAHWKFRGDDLELDAADLDAPLSRLADGVICSTSGSTGQPKIVVCSRGFIDHHVVAVRLQCLHAGDRHITALPTTHCNAAEFSAVGCYFGNVEAAFVKYAGAADLLDAADDFGAVHMNVVPTIVRDIVDSGLRVPVRWLFTAAAPLPGKLAREFASAHGLCRLFQGYGLSEASNLTAMVPLTDDPIQYGRDMLSDSPCVGTVMDDQRVKLADDGEILIAGETVMRCYWPDVDPKDEGWLRTGDLGRFRGDRLLITGRVREIINRGGEKLSPLEVERGIQLPDAIVVPARDVRMGENIGVVTGNLAAALTVPVVMAATTRAAAVTRSFKPRRIEMGSWLVSAQYPTAMYLRVEAAMLPLLEYLREVNGEFSLEAEMHRACHARSSSFDPMPAVINAARFMVSALRGGRDPTRMGALWVRLMCDEPMGVYARMVSMLAALQPGERVIEFGAGVGNLTGQFDLTHVEYLRTDCLPEMLNGRFQCEERKINFEHELPRGLLGQYDKALAVNALHCAMLPAQAVRNVSAALKPGGWLIVGEGSPVESWVMDPLFRFFDGWRGFRAREDWIEWFHEAGLRDVGYGRFVSGTVDLGGVVFGRRAP